MEVLQPTAPYSCSLSHRAVLGGKPTEPPCLLRSCSAAQLWPLHQTLLWYQGLLNLERSSWCCPAVPAVDPMPPPVSACPWFLVLPLALAARGQDGGPGGAETGAAQVLARGKALRGENPHPGQSKILSLLDEAQQGTGVEQHIRAEERAGEENSTGRAHAPGARSVWVKAETHWAPSDQGLQMSLAT